MYGPDADKLFESVHTILESCEFMQDAIAKLRYGPPEDGVKEIEIKIEPH
jgi:hypothetical protein